MNIHKIFIAGFRKKRMNMFAKLMVNSKPESSIIDVGGTAYNWEKIDYKGNVTILNLTVPEATGDQGDNYTFVEGDGTDLKYPDGAFDILFSNSVIEHLHTHENQKKFALEARRVGKALWIQTPARGFFIEPHYITPFIHFLPKNWQKRLLRNFSLWGLFTRPSQKEVDGMVNEIRLLDYSEFKELFPDCRIMKEKFLFFTKCYIAIKP